MCSLESLAFRLAQDTDFRAAFAADPDTALAAWDPVLDDTHRATLHDLCAQLALPGDSLLQQLLGDGPDAPDDPWIWTMAPCLRVRTEP
ncbi:MAG: hypothetical protein PVF47_17145 [Anaerolineae bacterium]|jgi:hypothetical protein